MNLTVWDQENVRNRIENAKSKYASDGEGETSMKKMLSALICINSKPSLQA